MDQTSPSPAPDDLIKAKAFTLTYDDVAIIEAVRREEQLRSDSSALRLLIREGRKYRELRFQAEKEIMARLLAEQETGEK